MKILFYNHTGQVSGAERVLLQIVKGLSPRDFDLVVLCPASSRCADVMREVGARTIGIRELNARFTWRPDVLVRYLVSFVSVIRCARRIVKREMPDLIHANSIRAGLVMTMAALDLPAPVIWHAHDILPRHPFSIAIRFVAFMRKRNHVVAVSRAVADRFADGSFRSRDGEQLSVVHNCVDLERFRPNARQRQETRRKLNLSDIDFVIASIGQLTPRKGQRELIDALALIAKTFPRTKLLIAGAPLFNRDEDYADSLRDCVSSLGLMERVRFLGPRDDVPGLMQALDVLVVNSQQEPFALTVLEGLASGAPVLATAVGGTPEMIRHGENGWLVKARDSEALAAGLARLISDPDLRKNLGDNGRASVETKYSIRRFLSNIESIYMLVTKGRPLPRLIQSKSLKRELSAD